MNPPANEKSRGLNVSATWDQDAREVIVKAVNVGERPLTAMMDLKGAPGVLVGVAVAVAGGFVAVGVGVFWARMIAGREVCDPSSS